MSSELQLDVCHLNRWWRHLVNAYEVKWQVWCLLQVKLCDPCLSALEWFVYHTRRYTITSARIYLYLYLTVNEPPPKVPKYLYCKFAGVLPTFEGSGPVPHFCTVSITATEHSIISNVIITVSLHIAVWM